MAEPYPRINVEAPARTARTGGLTSVVTPIDITDDHAQNGVQYEGDPCGALPDFAPGLCDPAYIPADLVPDEKDFGTGPNWAQTLPFALYVGYECWMPGADYEANALRVLEAGESYGIEKALSVAVLQGADVTVESGTFDIAHGVARLEALLGANYTGRGIIHMDRETASLAATGRVLVPDPAWSVWTQQGIPVSNGTGYELNGPGDTAPASGKRWIYATGDVSVFRSPADTYAADNVTHNTTDALAERIYNIGVDCDYIVALQVTI